MVFQRQPPFAERRSRNLQNFGARPLPGFFGRCGFLHLLGGLPLLLLFTPGLFTSGQFTQGRTFGQRRLRILLMLENLAD